MFSYFSSLFSTLSLFTTLKFIHLKTWMKVEVLQFLTQWDQFKFIFVLSLFYHYWILFYFYWPFLLVLKTIITKYSFWSKIDLWTFEIIKWETCHFECLLLDILVLSKQNLLCIVRWTWYIYYIMIMKSERAQKMQLYSGTQLCRVFKTSFAH